MLHSALRMLYLYSKAAERPPLDLEPIPIGRWSYPSPPVLAGAGSLPPRKRHYSSPPQRCCQAMPPVSNSLPGLVEIPVLT